jgi:nicotinate-nucleotide--dimethylbenzimidazole phosphoribosyltransferase
MAELLARTIAAVEPVGPTDELRARLDAKTKPRGSLGRLEDLAVRAAAAGARVDTWRPAIVVAAADHGVARQGVSAYPQEVTRQMLATFVGGGAAVCVLARQAGAELVVVDAGVVEPLDERGVRDLRLGAGTADFTVEAAMPRELAEAALEAGVGLADELDASPVALGDMGIANTTASAAVTAALLGTEPAEVCGRGTGIDGEQLRRKVDVVRRGLELHAPDPADPVGVLAAVGGFEIGVLAGVALGASARGVPVVLDGVITGAAALVAARLAPSLSDRLIASHRSPEPAHTLQLRALGLSPLLDLGLRLGEGSGAALALPLVRASLAILDEMATFEAAGVTDAGR